MLILLRILAIVWIVWGLLKMVGRMLSKSSHENKSAPPGNPPKNMVKDPVCGMYMDPRLAIRVQKWNGDLYFCSEECRNAYFSRSQ